LHLIVKVITVVTAAVAPALAGMATLAAAMPQIDSSTPLFDWHSQVELIDHYSVQVQQVSDVRFRQLHED